MLEDFTSDYDTLLTKANTDTILISRLKLVAMEMYKCINAINVPYLNDMFKVKDNKFGLRHQKNVVQPRFNTIKYGKHSFSYIGSHIWNMLPCHFQTAENINVFKSNQIKCFFIGIHDLHHSNQRTHLHKQIFI